MENWWFICNLQYLFLSQEYFASIQASSPVILKSENEILSEITWKQKQTTQFTELTSLKPGEDEK